MKFSDRVKISAEYREWLTAENEKNNFNIPSNPESFLAFLEIKGYLEEKQTNTAECYKAHEMIEDRLHCKNCGLEKVITGHWKEYNFCPKCGRKVDIYKTPYRQNDE